MNLSCPNKNGGILRACKKGEEAHVQFELSTENAESKGACGQMRGSLLNLQQGLAVVEITKQGEALAVYSVEKLSRFCVRLIACGSRQGVSQSC